MSDEIEEQLDDILTAHRAVLFMEGGPNDDAGNGLAVDSLAVMEVDVHYVDLRRTPALVPVMKARSDWENLPQFFVDGQFICDAFVMSDAILSGQLDKIFDQKKLPYSKAGADSIRAAN